ncbi:unnamed protein product [Chrysoparadoxa australica]
MLSGGRLRAAGMALFRENSSITLGTNSRGDTEDSSDLYACDTSGIMTSRSESTPAPAHGGVGAAPQASGWGSLLKPYTTPDEEEHPMVSGLKRNVACLDTTLKLEKKKQESLKKELELKNIKLTGLEELVAQQKEKITTLRTAAMATSDASSVAEEWKKKHDAERIKWEHQADELRAQLCTDKAERLQYEDSRCQLDDLRKANVELRRQVQLAQRMSLGKDKKLETMKQRQDQFMARQAEWQDQIEGLRLELRLQAAPLVAAGLELKRAKAEVEHLHEKLQEERKEARRKLDVSEQQRWEQTESYRSMEIDVMDSRRDAQELRKALDEVQSQLQQLQLQQQQQQSVPAPALEPVSEVAVVPSKEVLKEVEEWKEKYSKEHAEVALLRKEREEKHERDQKVLKALKDQEQELNENTKAMETLVKATTTLRQELETAQARCTELEKTSQQGVSGAVEKLVRVRRELLQAVEKLQDTDDASEGSLTCYSCLKLLKDPLTLVPCGHVMCTACFRKDQPSNTAGPPRPRKCRQCPGDRGKVSNMMPNKELGVSEAFCGPSDHCPLFAQHATLLLVLREHQHRTTEFSTSSLTSKLYCQTNLLLMT